MLVLFESSAGYALFQVLDDDKLQRLETISSHFTDLESAQQLIQVKKFSRFSNTVEALASLTKANEGKLPKKLKSMLKKQVVKPGLVDELGVCDNKLANMIKEKFGISCVSDSNILEVVRGIRSQFDGLVADVSKDQLRQMSLGLAHSLSRYKIKFSPDKVDTMIVQAVSLLDDLDKELNNYMMRCREWYGWHFPELSSIVTDGVKYAKVVQLMGFKEDANNCDFSSVITDETTVEAIKQAAEVSIGSEISQMDLVNIRLLCDQIGELCSYRVELSNYLSSRMNAIAPNLSVMVGEIVGARLIAHAGSLMSLAKNPSSTLQVFGAEKALFKALKSGGNTPKYGLIFHSSVVSQASTQFKGKASRSLAAKASLAARCDALSETQTRLNFTVKNRASLESRIRALENNQNKRVTDTGKFTPKLKSYPKSSEKTPTAYNPKNDFTIKEEPIKSAPFKRKFQNVAVDEADSVETFKKFKEDAKEISLLPATDTSMTSVDKIPKKKKKKTLNQPDDQQPNESH